MEGNETRGPSVEEQDLSHQDNKAILKTLKSRGETNE